MVYAPCPACALHHVGAVATPECPVCEGEARIALNPGLALAEGYDAWPDQDRIEHGAHNLPVEDVLLFGAGILCRAVWLGLARAARDTAGHPDVVRVDVLRVRVRAFREAHVLDSVEDVGRPGDLLDPRPGDGDLAAQLGATPVGPSFVRLPNGRPPVRSAAGHPAPLARLVDPVDLDTTPGQRRNDHARVWRVADELDRAVTLNAATHAHPDDLVGAAA